MALRSGGRKLSFDILNGDYAFPDDDTFLYRSNSDPIRQNGASELEDLYSSSSQSSSASSNASKNRRRKRKNKKKITSLTMMENSIAEEEEEDPITEKRVDTVFDDQIYRTQTVICEEFTVTEKENVRTVHQVSEPDFQIVHGDSRSFVELRQRNVTGSGGGGGTGEESTVVTGESNVEEKCAELGSMVQPKAESNGGFGGKLETAESLDWKQIMAEDSSYHSSIAKSPVTYIMGEIYSGNSLRGTTTLGNEKERERVYDTLFRLPWRCELLIDVGFFVCLDSFLSLLTIMPTRLFLTFWRFVTTRQFQRPSAAELSDFSCFIVLACGVALLERTDISLIYHMIRGQGTIKLYVVYNVLEIFDRLCQNFGGDVLQTMFCSAKGLASCSSENMKFWLWRFVSDQVLTVASSIVHSFILLAQAITLSTCIVAHNNALLALLVSNNFAEIKSNVFKRFSRENIHTMVYFDSVERFHISAFILFVLAQNILEAEGPWFGGFLSNALLVFVCEMIIDIIKHSFIAKFNEIKPVTYSEFLEDLCKQTLNMPPDDGKKSLTFIPLAPACVVIRVLTPVYAAHLPHGPPLWRLVYIFILLAMTYVMLATLKVMIGMGLHKHATWYVNRCQKRKQHYD